MAGQVCQGTLLPRSMSFALITALLPQEIGRLVDESYFHS